MTKAQEVEQLKTDADKTKKETEEETKKIKDDAAAKRKLQKQVEKMKANDKKEQAALAKRTA